MIVNMMKKMIFYNYSRIKNYLGVHAVSQERTEEQTLEEPEKREVN